MAFVRSSSNNNGQRGAIREIQQCTRAWDDETGYDILIGRVMDELVKHEEGVVVELCVCGAVVDPAGGGGSRVGLGGEGVTPGRKVDGLIWRGLPVRERVRRRGGRGAGAASGGGGCHC